MVATEARARDGFRHEGLVYAGDGEFLDAIGDFVADGVAAREPVLVVVAAPKIERLRRVLGRDAAGVQFADMAEVGANPARIIPAWRDFVNERATAGCPLRGVGEPISASRHSPELIECQRHESLLNLAFADARAFWLLCPYDSEALDPTVIDEARRSHPFIAEDGCRHASPQFAGIEAAPDRLEEPLPPPPATADELAFDVGVLEPLRRFVATEAARARLGPSQVEDLVIAVNEVVSNSVVHGGGGGTLQMWSEGDVVLCEVRDRGRIADPLAGRRRPTADTEGGRGLWLANQLCDLVQVRGRGGSVVRLHLRRDPDARPR
jgi:anti-sigma regulatory factor (Ser/Thr protein kinase)